MAMKINLRNTTGAIGITFIVRLEVAHEPERDAPRFTDDVNALTRREAAINAGQDCPHVFANQIIWHSDGFRMKKAWAK